MPLTTLILPPQLTATKTVKYSTKELNLGDGYTQTAGIGKNDGLEEWAIQSDWLAIPDIQNLVAQLSFLRGANPFGWTPEGAAQGKVYTCEKFEVVAQGRLQQLQATFVEHLEGECEPYRDQHLSDTELLTILENAKAFLIRFTRNEKPFMINLAYLLNNSFHDVLGRSGYFSHQSGTTEGQFVAIRAAMYAFDETGDEYWRQLALQMAYAAIEYLYPNKPFPPVNWQTLDENNISVAHWLINLEPVPSKAPVAADPLSNGYFNLVVNFVNGVGQIPYGAPTFGELLANVYRVIPMNEELLWNNVYAFPRYNSDNYYRIDYWVSNVALRGAIRRIYGTSDSPSGQQPTDTNEPVGMIKLVVPYTGQLKVTFMHYGGSIIGANVLYDPYPAWRLLDEGEALAAIDTLSWGLDAFKRLWESTGDEYWYRCMYYTLLTEIFAAQIKNSSAWYKKLTSPDPFRHPGSQVIVTPENDVRTYVASRNIGGDKDLWLKIALTASNQLYPSVEIQNFAVQPAIDQNTIIQVEAASSVATTLEVILSLSQNAFDFTKYYIARLPVAGGSVPTLRNFSNKEFIKWNPATNVWNPFIADNPIYTYSGLNGEVSVSVQPTVIAGVPRDAFKVDLWGRGGFSGAGFVTKGIAPDLAGAQPKLPLTVFCKLDDINNFGLQLKLTINSVEYYADIPAGDFDWVARTIKVSDLTLTGEPDSHPPADGVVTNIEIQGIGTQRGSFWVWYLGAAPEQLPSYAQTYKAALVSKVKTAHTLWCGNFEAVGAPTNALRYTPGINMFTMNIKKKGLESWRGAVPMSGYQDPFHLVLTEQWDRLPNMLKFLEDAQAEYTRQNSNRIVGMFMPGYVLNFWDASDYVDNRGYNVWTTNTIDPNYFWIGYTVRPAESTAHAWYLLRQKGLGGTKEAKQCERITMKYLGYLFTYFRKRNSYQPPTNITVNPDPTVEYHEPHASAFILRTALFANLCKGNPLITYSLIKGSYEYIKSQIVTDGLMAGSFFAGQPEYIVGSQNLREGFGFWFFEIIQAIALLHKHRNEVRLPSCSAPLG